ncbi:MAG TPA: alpha/beta hydrolase [Alphaproteobacteria bacterium]|nr:alpha/beta hydrolase [Alphaproteobacteria bacterium]
MSAQLTMRRRVLAFLVVTAVTIPGAAVRAGDARFTIPYGPDLSHRVDIFMPSPPKPGQRRAAVIYFHGGGWTIGSRVLDHYIGRALSEMGYVGMLADYRLFPFVRFPAFVHDGARAVAWLRSNAARYGVAPDRIYLMGHSAGAHIAMLLALDPRYLHKAGVPMHAVRGAIGLAGPYTANPRSNLVFRPVFAGLANPQEARPISFVGNTGPRLLLLHGGADLLVPPRQAREMGRRYREAGGEARIRVYPGANHMDMVLAFSQSERWRYSVFNDVRKFVGAP